MVTKIAWLSYKEHACLLVVNQQWCLFRHNQTRAWPNSPINFQCFFSGKKTLKNAASYTELCERSAPAGIHQHNGLSMLSATPACVSALHWQAFTDTTACPCCQLHRAVSALHRQAFTDTTACPCCQLHRAVWVLCTGRHSPTQRPVHAVSYTELWALCTGRHSPTQRPVHAVSYTELCEHSAPAGIHRHNGLSMLSATPSCVSALHRQAFTDTTACPCCQLHRPVWVLCTGRHSPTQRPVHAVSYTGLCECSVPAGIHRHNGLSMLSATPACVSALYRQAFTDTTACPCCQLHRPVWVLCTGRHSPTQRPVHAASYTDLCECSVPAGIHRHNGLSMLPATPACVSALYRQAFTDTTACPCCQLHRPVWVLCTGRHSPTQQPVHAASYTDLCERSAPAGIHRYNGLSMLPATPSCVSALHQQAFTDTTACPWCQLHRAVWVLCTSRHSPTQRPVHAASYTELCECSAPAGIHRYNGLSMVPATPSCVSALHRQAFTDTTACPCCQLHRAVWALYTGRHSPIQQPVHAASYTELWALYTGRHSPTQRPVHAVSYTDLCERSAPAGIHRHNGLSMPHLAVSALTGQQASGGCHILLVCSRINKRIYFFSWKDLSFGRAQKRKQEIQQKHWETQGKTYIKCRDFHPIHFRI